MRGAWPQGQCTLDMSCSWLCLTVPAHNTLPAPPAVHIQLTTSQMATSDDIVKIAVGVAASPVLGQVMPQPGMLALSSMQPLTSS